MLANTVRRQIHQAIGNIQSSVSAEVLQEPVLQEDGTYLVAVEVPGGAYGGKSQLQAVYTDTIAGVVGSPIRKGDIVMISFDEKGYAYPRITSVISLQVAQQHMKSRSRPVTSQEQRVETTSLMGVF